MPRRTCCSWPAAAEAEARPEPKPGRAEAENKSSVLRALDDDGASARERPTSTARSLKLATVATLAPHRRRARERLDAAQRATTADQQGARRIRASFAEDFVLGVGAPTTTRTLALDPSPPAPVAHWTTPATWRDARPRSARLRAA